MTFLEIVETCSAVLVSLGGGGAIVFGLSNYLGKVWAERGLEKQRQEYTKLNLEFSHQLDLASRRVQMEIDALGVLRKLSAESEFSIMQELWQRLMKFRESMSTIQHGVTFATNDKRLWWNQECAHCQVLYKDARDLLFEKTLSIPKPIAEIVQKMLRSILLDVTLLPHGFLDAPDSSTEASEEGVMTKAQILRNLQSAFKRFEEDMKKVESTMRDYIAGKTPDVQS